MQTASIHDCFEFEDFRLDARHMLLFRGHDQIDLAPKVIETLVALVQNNGIILNKDELMQLVWPDTIVDESNIFQNLYLLRKTLGNKADGTPFIETLRRRGYRFSADVGIGRPLDVAAHLETSLPSSTFSDENSLDKRIVRTDRQFSNGGLIILAAVLLCFMVTGLASVFYRPWGGTSVEANTPRQLPASIAVLPFRIMGSGTEELSQGLCDALITKLGGGNKVIVRPTSAVRQFTNPDRNVVEIGRMQGVEAVLDGSIQQEIGRVRVTVQLIDTLSGVTIWSSQFDETSASVMDIQDVVSERVIGEMTDHLDSPH